MREILDGDLGKVFHKFTDFSGRDFKINEVFDGGILDGSGCGLFIGNLNDVCGRLWNKTSYIRDIYREKMYIY